ncbi:MAG TPA: glycosyltransferase family 2 protein [Mycobacteriales bacterium]|nr:glycosyltransferase family 2 protein [Mycobacteriales bacterium]
MSTSWVIVTWNSAATLGALLDSIQAQDGAPHEVIVVDNASHDDTVALARRHPIGARVIANDTNRGLAAGNNQGLQAAEGRHLVICNPDVVLHDGCAKALVACAERHPRSGFVVARLHLPDGSLQPGVGDLPTLKETLLGRKAAQRRGSESGIWWDGWSHDQERAVGHGQEACYLVRREAYRDVGPQDERYRLDWEGLDWSERVHRAGWEIWFCPDAIATHVGGHSIRQAQLRWIVSSHRGMYRYFADRRSTWARPLLALAFGLRAGLKTCVFLVRRDAYHVPRSAPQP